MNEAAFKTILSGERRGVGPSMLRGALGIASLGYGLGVRLRNAAYNFSWKRAHRAPVPVISVGNITAGGTGKTPFVAWLSRWLQDRGRRPAILSRGYRSLDGHANDEKLVLDRLCPGVPHVQNRDRVAGAKVAIDRHEADVLILDDGFQHRRLARDLDIVLIDALNPWGYGRLLPRGLLREPLAGLRRADVLLLTRADQASSVTLAEIRARLEDRFPVVGLIGYPAETLVDNAGNTQPVASLAGQRVLAFCGIGNPEGFQRLLTAAGWAVARMIPFPDHHHYTGADLDRLVREARDCGAAAIVTTEKDLVKVSAVQLDGLPLWAVRIRMSLLANAQALEERLAELLAQCPLRPQA